MVTSTAADRVVTETERDAWAAYRRLADDEPDALLLSELSGEAGVSRRRARQLARTWDHEGLVEFDGGVLAATERGARDGPSWA